MRDKRSFLFLIVIFVVSLAVRWLTALPMR